LQACWGSGLLSHASACGCHRPCNRCGGWTALRCAGRPPRAPVPPAHLCWDAGHQAWAAADGQAGGNVSVLTGPGRRGRRLHNHNVVAHEEAVVLGGEEDDLRVGPLRLVVAARLLQGRGGRRRRGGWLGCGGGRVTMLAVLGGRRRGVACLPPGRRGRGATHRQLDAAKHVQHHSALQGVLGLGTGDHHLGAGQGLVHARLDLLRSPRRQGVGGMRGRWRARARGTARDRSSVARSGDLAARPAAPWARRRSTCAPCRRHQ
jgi:hypothetical protein